MRLHPLNLRRSLVVTPKRRGVRAVVEGKNIYIPPGTYIAYSARAAGRNKAIFGEDADAFNPERWLEETDGREEPTRFARMRKVDELQFGYGEWVCVGKEMALMQLHKVVFEIFRNFDLSLWGEKEVEMEDVQQVFPVWVCVVQRT
jgi:cytochrome P450